jgi:hypothetical protein
VLLIEERRELADCHSVTRRDRIPPHERLELGVEHRAFHDLSANGIGAVEDDERDTLFLGRFHRERHCRHVRPRTPADFLEIVDEDIDVPEHRLRRTAIFRLVQRVYRDAGRGVRLVLDLEARRSDSAETMLGGKQRHELQVLVPRDEVDVHVSRAVGRRMIGDETDALSLERCGDVGDEDFDPGPHHRRGWLGRCRDRVNRPVVSSLRDDRRALDT